MNDIEKQFVGVWDLRDWTHTNLSTGAVSQVHGGDYAGNLLYTLSGWVSVSLIEKTRPNVSEDRAARYALHAKLKYEGYSDLSDAEMEHLMPYALSAFGFISYFGTFEADDTEVRHLAITAARPNHVGQILPRKHIFKDNMLTLYGDAGGFRDTLLWARVAP
ncbi:MAG: lipocalin-like domain-containing protein [Pseudomonadota bacterium]